MIQSLPDELLSEIIKHIDVSPVHLYSLRMINKKFFHIITNNTFTFDPSYLSDKSYHDLCRTKLSVDSFDWFLKNGVQLTIPQINLFIKYNRADIIKRGFHYKQFLDTLFNRFYIHFGDEDIFSLLSSENPITIAVIYHGYGSSRRREPILP